MRWLRWAALVPFALVLAMLAASGWLLLEFRLRPVTALALFGIGCIGALTAALGLVIAWRVRNNAVGPLLCWVGSVLVFLVGRQVYYTIAIRRPQSLPLDNRVVAALEGAGWWLMAALALLLLYFPDGRLPSHRWRLIPPALITMGALLHVSAALDSAPFLPPVQDLARPYWPAPAGVELLSICGMGLMLAGFLACVASLVIRFRRSSDMQRAQLKWLALDGAALGLYPFVCLAEIAATGHPGPISVVFGVLALSGLPIVIAIGFFGQDFYDVDRVLTSTLSYGFVTAVLLVIYAATAVSLGLVLGRNSAVAAAVVTMLTALALAPLRSRLQRLVDQRFYPIRRAALLAIDELQQRVHSGQAQPEQLEEVLRRALRDPTLRIGLLVPGSREFRDAAGSPVDGPVLKPVLLAGEQVGALTSTRRTPPAVLGSVASAIPVLVEVIRLRTELSQALREVHESRARLVQAESAERRRLERDLHDGVQQRLVSLGMAMRLAQRHLHSGGLNVDSLLNESVAELATAITELRHIGHGLRPISLDDGLHAALATATQRLPVPVHLEISADRIPENLVTTAYYVACEAVTNAAKYADADRIAVSIAQSNGMVKVRVEDDGQGGAKVRPGSGLAGLVDRVAALGGSLSLYSPSGCGTVIEADLPCAS